MTVTSYNHSYNRKATKSKSQVEDEKASSSHYRLPKDKPPRHDKRKRRTNDTDKDLSKSDKDLSLKHIEAFNRDIMNFTTKRLKKLAAEVKRIEGDLGSAAFCAAEHCAGCGCHGQPVAPGVPMAYHAAVKQGTKVDQQKRNIERLKIVDAQLTAVLKPAVQAQNDLIEYTAMKKEVTKPIDEQMAPLAKKFNQAKKMLANVVDNDFKSQSHALYEITDGVTTIQAKVQHAIKRPSAIAVFDDVQIELLERFGENATSEIMEIVANVIKQNTTYVTRIGKDALTDITEGIERKASLKKATSAMRLFIKQVVSFVKQARRNTSLLNKVSSRVGRMADQIV
jgi:hypothetical protein